MGKELKNYLHLYLQAGIKCQRMGEEGEAVMTGISYDDTQKIWWVYFENEESGYAVLEDVFPLLRPLDSMTEEEKKELINISSKACTEFKGIAVYDKSATHSGYISGAETVYLLSKHFDLFSLIENNLAIDKTIKQ